jgi:DNA-binding IclR family transcriptional regulator
MSIAILDGMEVLIVDRLRSYRAGIKRTSIDLKQGSRLPAYCTATGKVLLANLPADELRRRLKETTLVKHGPNTILSKRKLIQELNTVFENGLAVSSEEWCREGLVSIAAPVFKGSAEVIAAIDITAPTSAISVSRLVDEIGPHLIAIADLISTPLGFRREKRQ